MSLTLCNTCHIGSFQLCRGQPPSSSEPEEDEELPSHSSDEHSHHYHYNHHIKQQRTKKRRKYGKKKPGRNKRHKSSQLKEHVSININCKNDNDSDNLPSPTSPPLGPSESCSLHSFYQKENKTQSSGENTDSISHRTRSKTKKNYTKKDTNNNRCKKKELQQTHKAKITNKHKTKPKANKKSTTYRNNDDTNTHTVFTSSLTLLDTARPLPQTQIDNCVLFRYGLDQQQQQQQQQEQPLLAKIKTLPETITAGTDMLHQNIRNSMTVIVCSPYDMHVLHAHGPLLDIFTTPCCCTNDSPANNVGIIDIDIDMYRHTYTLLPMANRYFKSLVDVHNTGSEKQKDRPNKTNDSEEENTNSAPLVPATAVCWLDMCIKTIGNVRILLDSVFAPHLCAHTFYILPWNVSHHTDIQQYIVSVDENERFSA